MHESEKYCAVIADMVDSTKMTTQERRKVQEELQKFIDDYNIKFKSSIAVKINFSGGDQLQTLFNNAHNAYEFACDFREKMFPVKFRIGLGVGNWSLDFPGDNTNKQDGTSYRNARKAYEHARKFNKNIVLYSDSEMDAFVNVLIAQEYAIFNSQKPRQKEIFIEYKNMYPICPTIKKESDVSSIFVDKGSQKDIAEKLGVSRQNINNIVRSGSIYNQRDLQGAIVLLLLNFYV